MRVKELRYACDSFERLYASNKLKRMKFLTMLEDLQQKLGDLNDLASLQATLRQSAGRAGGDSAAEYARQERRLIVAADAVQIRLRDSRPFWE
jgi:triphosphatase